LDIINFSIMTHSKKPKSIFIINICLVFLSACNIQSSDYQYATTEKTEEIVAALEDTDPIAVAPMDAEYGSSSKEFKLPVILEEIVLVNADQVGWLASLYPKAPPYIEISQDGSFMAIGEPGRLAIFDAETATQISQFEIEFPNCAYGFERYFQFNRDGLFIAVITKNSLQVFQTGGGLIYENFHSRPFDHRSPSCGFDLPQVALSPDGKLLAETGIDYSLAEPTRYFRVVDILANEVLYEWDGKNDSLHGNLLGFSGDGQVIHTFDPKRYILSAGKLNEAFRFWSVKTWDEVTDTDILRASFFVGELLFSLSDSDHVIVLDKLTGEAVAEIPAQGCKWDMPCETVFSKDGSKVLLLTRENSQVQLGPVWFFQEIEVWDLEKGDIIMSVSGYFRDLNGLQIADSGELVNFVPVDPHSPSGQGWRVIADHFQGLQMTQEDEIAFVANIIGNDTESECQFCNTCIVQPQSGEISCQAGIEGPSGRYSIRLIDTEYWLVKHYEDGEGKVGKLRLQPSGDPGKLRMRLLSYSEDNQTAFYCQDMEFRPQKCVIDDLGSSQVVEEFSSLSFLRLSPDEDTAALLDPLAKALFLYDLDSNKLTRKSHYQAKAAMVNPVFSDDGLQISYLVENLNRPGVFSVEVMDVESQKILKRTPLEGRIESPVAFALNNKEDVWAIASKLGGIYFFSAENGKLLKEWDAEQDQIIGLIFDEGARLLISLDQTGLMEFWGVVK